MRWLKECVLTGTIAQRNLYYDAKRGPGGESFSLKQHKRVREWLAHGCDSHSALLMHRAIWGKMELIAWSLELLIAGCGISCEISLIWISLDFTDDQSTLVHVMTAPSHNLSPCWPRYLSPYDVTRPQWVNKKISGSCIWFKRIPKGIFFIKWSNIFSTIEDGSDHMNLVHHYLIKRQLKKIRMVLESNKLYERWLCIKWLS